MQFKRHVNEWWFEPQLKKKRHRIPKYVLARDPHDPSVTWKLPPNSRVGQFNHSRKWVRYNRLQAIEAGYITPLYDLAAIAKRYGLSDAGKRYFRNYILPEPIQIVRRRAVNSHHWSRFTLMALDAVMLDLEKRGFHQFLKSYEDHVDLVHIGNDWLEVHYRAIAETKVTDLTDCYGVQWLE